MTGILLAFFALFRGDIRWVSSGFYFFAQILGALLLSQFWTLANDVYDPRQARRLFGFIGGGASLGGMAGSGLAALFAGQIGTPGLLLTSAAALVAAAGIVVSILLTETLFDSPVDENRRPAKTGVAAALTLVRQEPNLQQIAALVSFAAVGSVLIDQQLNMAAEQFRGGSEDAVTSFLASVRFLLSTVSLVLQVVFVKRIYRLLGMGFAVLALPVSLGVTAALILVTGALWAPTVASIVDRSIRYTVDRTTREIFFLPLPGWRNSGVPGPGPVVSLDGWVRDSGVADEPNPPVSWDRFRSADPPGQPRRHWNRDPGQRGTVGIGGRSDS